MRQGAANPLNRRAPLVPKELIVPVCQRLAFVLFAMCSTALGIRLYARYKLGTLGGKGVGRLSIPFVNGTHFFVDIGRTSGTVGDSQTKQLEESGWKGVCVKPFPDTQRSCEAISMPVVPTDGDRVMVPDCTGRPSPLKVVLAAFSDCPQVERAGVSINALLKISKAPSIIDFVNLDTGGSEVEILKKFPFDQFCVRAWAVNKAAPQSKIGKLLEAKNCQVKEAPTGYFARCSCSDFKESLLQIRATATAPMTRKHLASPWEWAGTRTHKVARQVYKKKHHSALVSSIVPGGETEHLDDTDENALLGGASGLGGSLMRRSFA